MPACHRACTPVRRRGGAVARRVRPADVVGPATQREPTLDGPLQVVADDFVSSAAGAFEPRRERLVQLGMRARRTAAVRGRMD